jgi:hypothetical protein
MRYEVTMSGAGGTFLQGLVVATYSELVNAFGQPLPGDGEKTQAEWIVEFCDENDDLHVATIYDWRKDTPPEQVTVWNVGGFKSDVVEMVQDAIAYALDMRYEEDNRMYQWDLDWAEQDESRPDLN